MLTAKKQKGFLVFLLFPFLGWSQTFRVTIAPSLQQENLDGRLLLLISKTNKTEPLFQINDAAGTQLVFGIDIDGWQPRHSQLVDIHAFGYPLERLGDIPAGDYCVQVLLHDKNAYYVESDFRHTPRPGERDYLGHVSTLIKDFNQRELALGTRSRSGDQFDIWEAVFSPMDADGYPKRIFDKYTGAIDSSVAAYWKEHFDLAFIIRRDWPRLGEQLKGKIHIYVGDMDTYYLNNAVYAAEDILKKLNNPVCDCQVDYGDRAEHCWNGDHTLPNYISRLRHHQMYIKKWAEEVKTRAPKGADLKSWRY